MDAIRFWQLAYENYLAIKYQEAYSIMITDFDKFIESLIDNFMNRGTDNDNNDEVEEESIRMNLVLEKQWNSIVHRTMNGA